MGSKLSKLCPHGKKVPGTAGLPLAFCLRARTIFWAGFVDDEETSTDQFTKCRSLLTK
jgi:hypothetical protein